MKNIPSVELLKSTHTFPGPYTFKVIGNQTPEFVARVIAAVRDEMKYAVDPPYQLKESSGGKHVSVNMEIAVDTPDVVRAVYMRLAEVPDLILLL